MPSTVPIHPDSPLSWFYRNIHRPSHLPSPVMPSSLAASAAEVIFIDVDEFSAAQQPNPRRAPAPTTGPSRGVSGSDSDDEVVFEGFRRQVMSTHKQADFDTNGFTYMGFADGKSIRRVNSHLQGQNIQPARPKTSEGDSIATAIEILDDEDDPPSHSGGLRTEGPPRKVPNAYFDVNPGWMLMYLSRSKRLLRRSLSLSPSSTFIPPANRVANTSPRSRLVHSRLCRSVLIRVLL